LKSLKNIFKKMILFMKIRKIKLRELKEADIFKEKILNPEKKRRYRPYYKILKNYKREPSLFIGAYDKNRIIGVAFGHIIKNRILLGEMAVLEEYRNKGIGKKILKKIEQNSKKLNKKYIELGALDNAEKFYLKQNYKPIIFVQIYPKNILKNYNHLNYKIIKETNYVDSKRFYIEVKRYDPKLKEKIDKEFKAYDVIYLFRKYL